MNGKPEIDEARTCKPQILMISPKFFMTEVCKMMIRSHRTNKVLIKTPLLAINRFPNCRWLYFSSSLISSFERCRFVTQIRDFSYVKLQHECSSFSLTLKMRQNYILDKAKDVRIDFPVLTVPSHCRIKIILFKNHRSESRGRFATTDVRNILYRINFKREHLKNFCKRSQKCNHLNWMKQLVNCLLLGISNTCDWKKRRVFHIQPHTYRK